MPVSKYLQSDKLAKFPFLFIVTYGRSGSTLLQGILNSIPNYCIRGENYGALFKLFLAYDHLRTGQRSWRRVKTAPNHAWYGMDIVMPEAFGRYCADAFLDTCLRPPADARSTGFKEIRYTPKRIGDREFAPYLDFITEFFPGAGFIFNLRQPLHTASSSWWREQKPEDVVKLLSATEARFRRYAEGRDNCTIFQYDELIADSRYAEHLFRFLDEPFDAARIQAVLDVKHAGSAAS
jgi:hypothetical protein